MQSAGSTLNFYMSSSAELDQFLAEVEKRAYAMTMMSVQNSQDALDIVQDAMLTLATKYAHKSREEWAPLFFRILKNRTTDHLRRAQRSRSIFAWFGASSETPDPIDAAIAPERANPAQEHASDAFVDELQNALAVLPGRQREAFLLRAWQGLDVAQTALAMKVSQGSVKTHYSRAVKALRAQLGEFDHV